MALTHAVRGLTEMGREWFYTGKGGSGWVSMEKSAAFLYTLEGAQRKALMFNRTTELHGLRFVAVAVDCQHIDFTENQDGDASCRKCGLTVAGSER